MGSLKEMRYHKVILIIVAIFFIASIVMHVHPSMGNLHDELKTKAPTIFKLFLAGESIYFGGMFLMAVGVGASLGSNPLVWAKKLHSLTPAGGAGLARAKIFWIGLLLNAIGATTFSGIGIYVALEILPHGSWTLIPAAVVDIGFSLFIRGAIYKKASPAKEATSS